MNVNRDEFLVLDVNVCALTETLDALGTFSTQSADMEYNYEHLSKKVWRGSIMNFNK